jgi:hypothetical protein
VSVTFVVGDLTEQDIDALVNAANEALVAADPYASC